MKFKINLCLNLLTFLFYETNSFKSSQNVLIRLIDERNIKSVTIMNCEANDIKALLNLRRKLGSIGAASASFSFDNVTQINQSLSFQNYLSVMVMDLGCTDAQNYLERLSELHLFNESRQFVFIGSDLNSTRSLLKDHNISVNSKIILVVHCGVPDKSQDVNEAEFRMYQVTCSNCRRESKLRLIEIGSYRSDHFQLNSSKVNYDFEQDIARVGFMVPLTPKGRVIMEYIEGNDRNYQDNAYKWGFRVSKLLGEMYNFKIHWIRTNVYGFIPNKDVSEWPGITGMLRDGMINFSSCAFSLNTQRVSVADFGNPLFTVRQRFIFRYPKNTNIGTKNPFIMPLTDDAWIAVLLTSILQGCLFFFIHVYENLLENSITSTVITIIAMLTLQDVTEGFRSLPAKIGIMIFFFLTFMFQQFYSGGILSSVLTPPPRTIRDMPSLIASDLKVAVQNSPTSISMFLMGNDETGKIIWKKKIDGIAPRVFVPEGVSYIRKGGYAFFGYIDYSYDYIKRTFPPEMIDELQEIEADVNVDLLHQYVPIAKHSPYKEPIKVGVMKIIEYGLNGYLKKNWTVVKPVGSSGETHLIELSLTNFSSLFYLLIISYGLSFMFLIGEIVLCKQMCKKGTGYSFVCRWLNDLSRFVNEKRRRIFRLGRNIKSAASVWA